MFVDLMHDIHDTFTQNFLKVQIVAEEPPPAPTGLWTPGPSADGAGDGGRPRRRYNALGILEEVSDEEAPVPASADSTAGEPLGAVDVAPAEPPKKEKAVRRDPVVVTGGRQLSQSAGATGPIDWSTVGRNDPCPCGSGKKFKKCHGAQV